MGQWLANQAEKRGDFKASQELRKLAESNKEFQYEIVGTPDGDISKIIVGSGSEAREFDLGEKKHESKYNFTEPKTFILPNGYEVTGVGTITSDGPIHHVSMVTSEGLNVNFSFESDDNVFNQDVVTARDAWNLKVSPPTKMEKDSAYVLLNYKGGKGFRLLDMTNPAVAEPFINNLASTVGARTKIDLKNSTVGRAGVNILVLSGYKVSEKYTNQDIIHGLYSLAYKSSFRPDGTFDYDKFRERANALTDILWAKNRGAALGHHVRTPESVAKGYIEPDAEALFREMMQDYKKVKAEAGEKVQEYFKAMKKYRKEQREGSW